MIWAPPNDVFDTPGFSDHERYVRNVVRNMIHWSDLPRGGKDLDRTAPIDGEVICTVFPPPPFEDTDMQVGEVTFHLAKRTVEVNVPVRNRCRSSSRGPD